MLRDTNRLHRTNPNERLLISPHLVLWFSISNASYMAQLARTFENLPTFFNWKKFTDYSTKSNRFVQFFLHGGIFLRVLDLCTRLDCLELTDISPDRICSCLNATNTIWLLNWNNHSRFATEFFEIRRPHRLLLYIWLAKINNTAFAVTMSSKLFNLMTNLRQAKVTTFS